MEFHRGSDRTVIVGKKRTLKIARSNPFRFIQSVYKTYTRHGAKGIKYKLDSEDIDTHHGIKWQLLHGISANQREHRISVTSELVVPTRMLLAGIVNIQPTTPDADINYRDASKALTDHLDRPGRDKARLGHMLEDSANFGVYQGAVRFRDGGSYGLERLLCEGQGPNLKRALGALATRQK